MAVTKKTSVKGSTVSKSAPKAKKPAFSHIGTSEYNGHDLITFAKDAKDTRPFQFGKSKAAQLLAAIDAHGADAVTKALRDLVEG